MRGPLFYIIIYTRRKAAFGKGRGGMDPDILKRRGRECYARDDKVFGERPFEFLETYCLRHGFRTSDSICERPEDHVPKEEA